MEVINVGLYGGKSIFGGRETPLEASVVSCDKFENCSYYKNSQCLNVRAPFGSRCKYGGVSNVKGYTSRAMKYYSFKDKWKNHEKYSLLSHPPEKLGLIENEVVFPYTHISIKENNGNFELDVPYFSSHLSFISYERFDVELINRICNFRPQAMMGGEITSYQNKIVPLFLTHLKEILPERYDELKQKYGGLVKEIDYVGRKALLKTIKSSFVQYRSKRYPKFDEKWFWDGQMLVYKEGYISSFSITNDYEIIEIKIKPSDKSIVKITSNDQVTENTVFID